MHKKDNYNQIYNQLIEEDILDNIGNGFIKGMKGLGKGIGNAWKWNKKRIAKNNINTSIVNSFSNNNKFIQDAITKINDIINKYNNKQINDINEIISTIKEQKQVILTSITSIKETIPNNTIIISFLNNIEKIGKNVGNFINNNTQIKNQSIINYVNQQMTILNSKLEQDFLKSILVAENYQKIYLNIINEQNEIYHRIFELKNYINSDNSYSLSQDYINLYNYYHKLIQNNNAGKNSYTYENLIENIINQSKANNKQKNPKINNFKAHLEKNIISINQIYNTFKKIFNSLNQTELLNFNIELITLLKQNYGEFTIKDKQLTNVINATKLQLEKISTQNKLTKKIHSLKDNLNNELKNISNISKNKLIKNEEDINQYNIKQKQNKEKQEKQQTIKNNALNKIYKIMPLANYISKDLEQTNIIKKVLKAFKKDKINNISNFNLNIQQLNKLIKDYFIAGMISTYNENKIMPIK